MADAATAAGMGDIKGKLMTVVTRWRTRIFLALTVVVVFVGALNGHFRATPELDAFVGLRARVFFANSLAMTQVPGCVPGTVSETDAPDWEDVIRDCVSRRDWEGTTNGGRYFKLTPSEVADASEFIQAVCRHFDQRFTQAGLLSLKLPAGGNQRWTLDASQNKRFATAHALWSDVNEHLTINMTMSVDLDSSSLTLHQYIREKFPRQ
jgi:hypothetical protein